MKSAVWPPKTHSMFSPDPSRRHSEKPAPAQTGAAVASAGRPSPEPLGGTSEESCKVQDGLLRSLLVCIPAIIFDRLRSLLDAVKGAAL